MSAMRSPQEHYHPSRRTTWYLVASVTLILALMVWQIATTGTL